MFTATRTSFGTVTLFHNRGDATRACRRERAFVKRAGYALSVAVDRRRRLIDIYAAIRRRAVSQQPERHIYRCRRWRRTTPTPLAEQAAGSRIET